MPNEDTLTMRSTQQGYVSQYFWACMWSIIIALVALRVDAYILDAYASVGAETLADYKSRMRVRSSWIIVDGGVPLMHIIWWFCAVLDALIVLVQVWTVIYSARTVNVFHKNTDGKWGKVVETSYTFPASVTRMQQVFDRVTDITVSQSAIDRLLGTGSIKLTLATFANVESEEFEWTVAAVKDPYHWEGLLSAALPDGAGLRIKQTV